MPHKYLEKRHVIFYKKRHVTFALCKFVEINGGEL